jgi:hypothetical protein
LRKCGCGFYLGPRSWVPECHHRKSLPFPSPKAIQVTEQRSFVLSSSRSHGTEERQVVRPGNQECGKQRRPECGVREEGFICKDSLRVGRFCSAPALPALAPRGSALSFEGCFLNRWENNCLAPAGLWAIGWYGERLRVGCVLRAPGHPARPVDPMSSRSVPERSGRRSPGSSHGTQGRPISDRPLAGRVNECLVGAPEPSRVPAGRITESTSPQPKPPNIGFSRRGRPKHLQSRVGAGANLSFSGPRLPRMPVLL